MVSMIDADMLVDGDKRVHDCPGENRFYRAMIGILCFGGIKI